MKTFIRFLAITSALLGGSIVSAQVISTAALNGFSPGGTIIDFSLPSGNAQPITTQYADLGVTFSGGLHTLRSFFDVDYFPSAGGQIASNWIYGGRGLQGSVLDLWFSSGINRLGTYANFYSSATLTWDFYAGGKLLGSASHNGGFTVSTTALFYGFQSASAFDHVQLTLSGGDSHFLALDNLRFESNAVLSAVPESSTFGIGAAFGLLSLGAYRRFRQSNKSGGANLVPAVIIRDI